MKTAIWWIRRDLRLQENPTLIEACAESTHLIPLFILDPLLLDQKSGKRIQFLYQAVDSLNRDLQARGSRLVILSGDPLSVLKQVVSEVQAEMIYAEEDYSPYARQRDHKVAAELPLWWVQGLTIFPPGMVVKNTGCPYTIFTPFKRTFTSLPLPDRQMEPAVSLPPLPANAPASQEIPAYQAVPDFEASEHEARRRFSRFLDGPILEYGSNRDRMDLDGTSRLSPYLRFGLISALYCYTNAQKLKETASPEQARHIETWQNEMIWREFYISIMHHFPEVMKGSFRKDLRNIRWRNQPAEFEAWKNGQTGYPVVDAGIRQLTQTGWMHNRARMITASFLVKDLLVNWQSGEEWFMQQLIDGDPAANNGGWQWTSGVGTDAAPYFRIFNPILQCEKFDPLGDYVRKWVPELAKVPVEYINKPWEMPADLQDRLGIRIGRDYPLPIVDHKKVREQTLAAYSPTA
jgi:deoxyribodipyrimidine photo-lyase